MHITTQICHLTQQQQRQRQRQQATEAGNILLQALEPHGGQRAAWGGEGG